MTGDAASAPAPYRCIKPQCPNDCSMCNHAIPSDDEAIVLIADMLDRLAINGFDEPLADGENAVVDRARAFLRKGNRSATPDTSLTHAARAEPVAIPNDPACTCGSDSPRAYNHAQSCPHSTPWNDRVKARLAAYEFFNPATGHAIVDYSEHTHVGHLTAAKGYEKRPLVYAEPTLTHAYAEGRADEREEAGEDAQRLDWLESDGCTCVFRLGNRWYTREGYGLPYHRANSLRAAIDSAMNKEQA